MTSAADGAQGWLEELNDSSAAAARERLLSVCSSTRWAQRVAQARPFADAGQLQRTADSVWLELEPADWLDALRGHPRIGERGGSSQEHSAREQAGVSGSPPSVIAALAEGNRRYEARFGHVFLISAAGRSAEEILGELTRRMGNARDEELREAVQQHRRITRLRLERLLGDPVAGG